MSALTTLQLTDFRSYTALDLSLDERPVVLFGANGAGKTNILEAISFLAPGRGMRRVTMDAPVRHHCESGAWSIHAVLARKNSAPFALGTGFNPQKRVRRVRIDGEDARAGALADLLRLVWLTPAQDRLFAGPRGARLRFFDRLTLSLHPDHGRHAGAYERAMRDRQKLLEDGHSDPAWLEACEKQMAEAGARIMSARADTAAHLQEQVNARKTSAFPQADIALEHLYEGAPEADHNTGQNTGHNIGHNTGQNIGASDADIENCACTLSDIFASTRRRDAAAGRALSGPHRANLQVLWRAKAMPAALSSTGEQKALLIGITLAHARAVAAKADTPAPLVLLDEACAHLDPDRRAALIDEVCAMDSQGWLTGTDHALFDAFGTRAQVFEVGEGAAKKV